LFAVDLKTEQPQIHDSLFRIGSLSPRKPAVTSPVWLVLRRHTTEMKEVAFFPYYKEEKNL
jgi:hypothetical protein